MKKYYLYGAGINCIGVIKFFGKENIIAIIDSDEKKQGNKLEGIEIISLSQYINKNKGETIVITGFYESKAIANSLESYGILNYYISPYMQMGYYENVEEIIEKLRLGLYSQICFATENPISQMVANQLQIRNPRIDVRYGELTSVHRDTVIIVTNESDKEILMQNNEADSFQNVLDINEIYHRKYGYKNKEIEKFKDIHKGKRCFIIGNGPSLTYEDLNCLKENNEICFGVNRIYLSYEFTEWRPDYYVAVDYYIVNKDKEMIETLEGTKFVRHFYKTAKKWDSPDIIEFRGLANVPGKPEFSEDMREGIFTGNTVVYDAVQIAYYMGFDEIYLLGVDMTSGIRAQDEGFHFYKSPDTKENLGIGNVVEGKLCLGYAEQRIKEKGRIFANATRGGALDEVSRVSLDSLLGGKEK